MITTKTIGRFSETTRDELQSVLIHAFTTFGVYRRSFTDIGIKAVGQLESREPLDVLQRLPPLDADTFIELADEGIKVGRHIVDMETSSGTTGPRKRRPISHADDASETTFLAELFGRCGIDESDSVACVDTGPLSLMVSFTRALDALGVEEAYAYSIGPDDNETIKTLAKLDPTVLVTIPSVLERYLGLLLACFDKVSGRRLTKVVYAGEPLSESTRASLESVLGVEVFGYYGACETSALGIECRRHDGIHLYDRRNLFEIVGSDPDATSGELLVTTLKQEALPLLRYELKDTVRIIHGDCSCGLASPRVEVMGRTDDTVSILGSKISYKAVLGAVYSEKDGAGPMRLVLERDGKERLTIILPYDMSATQSKIRTLLLDREPDLGYLVGSRFLDLEFDFAGPGYFESARKRGPRIVDLRQQQGNDRDNRMNRSSLNDGVGLDSSGTRAQKVESSI